MARFVVVRVNRNPKDTFAASHLREALDAAQADPGDTVQVCIVEASDAGMARLREGHWATLSARELGPVKGMSTTNIRSLAAVDGRKITYAQATYIRDTTTGETPWMGAPIFEE